MWRRNDISLASFFSFSHDASDCMELLGCRLALLAFSRYLANIPRFGIGCPILLAICYWVAMAWSFIAERKGNPNNLKLINALILLLFVDCC